MFWFALFDQYLKEKMSTLGFFNDFIVKKIKQKVTQLLPTKGGVVW